ncbi:MAG: amidohydrolase [Defluviitaleaceae bacterium]|nr:amidohydrolase [Defluviitaleaceae bacterium]MCL2264077.1 amidohydrolase [Defluviitaleaceae bacterium]
MEILFKNVTVVTMNEKNEILENVNIGVSGGKIKMNAEGKAERVIDCTNKVLMPGLYNCHTHAGMSLFRGYANDRTLEDWLFNHLIPAESKLTPALVRTGTLLSMAEMISSGTVAFSDMYCFMDEVAQTAREVGMLANICNGVIGFDESTFDYHACNEYKQTVKALEDIRADSKNDPAVSGVKIDASIHGVYTSFPRVWEQAMDFAKSNNLRMHVHLSETQTEHENCVKKYGKTPTAVFAEYGVFDVPCIAAHGVWLTDDDMAILAAKNVTIVHNPLSNLKLASGLAPVAKLQKAGVNVALGTDGVASNNSHDLFEELKMASLLQKYITSDPTALPAYEALKMATVNGAKAQGRQAESGTIQENYDADLILIDQNNPRQTMCYDPTLNLAYATSGRDVDLTMVRGKILYENGEFTTIDIEKVLHDAREAKKIFL